MTEQWLPIPDWEGHFEASDQGRIRNTSGEPILPWLASGRYLEVILRDGQRERRLRVHRIICLTFHGPAPESRPLALHNNGDNLDNRARNIRWGSYSDNLLDAVAHGTHGNQYRSRTECKHGHPFTIENTRKTHDRRRCLTCARNAVRASRQREKERAAV